MGIDSVIEAIHDAEITWHDAEITRRLGNGEMIQVFVTGFGRSICETVHRHAGIDGLEQTVREKCKVPETISFFFVFRGRKCTSLDDVANNSTLHAHIRAHTERSTPGYPGIPDDLCSVTKDAVRSALRPRIADSIQQVLASKLSHLSDRDSLELTEKVLTRCVEECYETFRKKRDRKGGAAFVHSGMDIADCGVGCARACVCGGVHIGYCLYTRPSSTNC